MSINFVMVFRYKQEEFLYVAAVTEHLLRSRLGVTDCTKSILNWYIVNSSLDAWNFQLEVHVA